MTRVSLERIADTLYPKEQPRNSTAYGSVESINADGSYQVKLNASATSTRCAKLCDADVGDRVLVLIQANGHCAAIGRVGGSTEKRVLLWTNPNPTSAFSAQTITGIPWQDYDELHVETYTVAHSGTSMPEHYEVSVIPTGNATTWTFATAHREVFFMRGVRFPTDGSVEFGKCIWTSSFNSSQYQFNDSYAFITPTRIWGVRY